MTKKGQPPAAPFDLWADIYDVVHRDFTEDVPLYVDYGARCGSPILEMACGTGRLVFPLVREGHEVWGFDASRKMVARARRKAAALPPAMRRKVHLSVQDMRTFALRRRFNLIFCAFQSFLHLMTPEDRRAGLENAGKHLADGGTLIIDVFAPLHHLLVQRERTATMVHKLDRGQTLIQHDLIQVDPVAQYIHVESVFEAYDAAGRLKKKIARPFDLCWIHRYEMEHLLELSGFRLDAILGGFDGRPYDYASGEAIYVARKA